METQQGLPNVTREPFPKRFSDPFAFERTLQRRGGARTSNTRTRGENVRRARIIDVDAQAVRTSTGGTEPPMCAIKVAAHRRRAAPLAARIVDEHRLLDLP